MKRSLTLSLVGLMLLSLAGCRHGCKRSFCGSGRSDLPPPRGYLEAPSRGRGTDLIPPPSVTTRPETLPEIREPSYSYPVEPAPSRFRPSAPAPARERIYPEGWLETPAVPRKPAGEPPAVLSLPEEPTSQRSSAKTVTPAGYTERMPTTGLPYFSMVMERVANGRKPNVEGFDTLRNAGFQSMLYLHDADKDISATKDLAEKKGFRFQAIPVSSSNVKSAFSQFAEAIGDKKHRPIFVFDDDGGRAGSLWYLYFRKIESLNEDAARVKAAPLGLRDATGDAKNSIWAATQDEVNRR
jgi:protein tyrosine phosphatase (PTP) superfamily phosphohydrolase (DUF442 family)